MTSSLEVKIMCYVWTEEDMVYIFSLFFEQVIKDLNTPIFKSKHRNADLYKELEREMKRRAS